MFRSFATIALSGQQVQSFPAAAEPTYKNYVDQKYHIYGNIYGTSSPSPSLKSTEFGTEGVEQNASGGAGGAGSEQGTTGGSETGGTDNTGTGGSTGTGTGEGSGGTGESGGSGESGGTGGAGGSGSTASP